MQIQTENIITIVVSITLIFLTGGLFLIIYINLYNEKKLKHLEEKELLKKQFDEVLLQSQLEIKEQTLQHIAYELHDNLGQAASLIKINLNTLRLDDVVKAEQKIEDTKNLVRQLITDLKSLSVSLSSNWITQNGILKSLENEVEKLNRTGHFESTLEQSGTIPSLDGNTTIILYRMMQEAINNAVKHSEAKRIALSVKATENLLILACRDNGIGFDRDTLKGNGSGLINLHNRARLIHAKLHIQSLRQNGTTISIELPL